jgi:hypothetical protein
MRRLLDFALSKVFSVLFREKGEARSVTGVSEKLPPCPFCKDNRFLFHIGRDLYCYECSGCGSRLKPVYAEANR